MYSSISRRLFLREGRGEGRGKMTERESNGKGRGGEERKGGTGPM